MNASAIARRIMGHHKAALQARGGQHSLTLADLLTEAVEAGYAAAQVDREISGALTTAALIAAHIKGRPRPP